MDWILCSVKSPEEEQEVLLTFKNHVGSHVGEATFKKGAYYYVAETDNGYFEEPYGIPVAWMSKPEPCKEEESSMKVFRVTYESSSTLGTDIVVCKSAEDVKGCLEERGYKHAVIKDCGEINVHRVRVRDLTAGDLIKLIKG